MLAPQSWVYLHLLILISHTSLPVYNYPVASYVSSQIFCFAKAIIAVHIVLNIIRIQ